MEGLLRVDEARDLVEGDPEVQRVADPEAAGDDTLLLWLLDIAELAGAASGAHLQLDRHHLLAVVLLDPEANLADIFALHWRPGDQPAVQVGVVGHGVGREDVVEGGLAGLILGCVGQLGIELPEQVDDVVGLGVGPQSGGLDPGLVLGVLPGEAGVAGIAGLCRSGARLRWGLDDDDRRLVLLLSRASQAAAESGQKEGTGQRETAEGSSNHGQSLFHPLPPVKRHVAQPCV